MKLEVPQKNQTKIVVTFVIVAILITIIVILGERIFIIDNGISDSQRFYTEYSGIPVENSFKYVTAKEAIELFKSEQAIVFFGFKECKWCQSYVPILNEVIEENKVETVYYCNIKEDRSNNTAEYKDLIEILKEYLYDDDNANKRIYVPDVYFIKDGKIVGHNNDTSTIEGADTEEYYTEKAKKELKETLTKLVQQVYSEKENCDDSKKGC